MRAVRWHARGDVRVEEVPPPPPPGPGEVQLQVLWCGICGTDLEEFTQGPGLIPTKAPNNLTRRNAPLTIGHEFTGTVTALGPGVTNLAPGDRVAPEVCLFCGECFFCRRHEYALCLNWAAIGLMTDGGLAEYVKVPAAMCVKLPDSLADEAAALVEPTEVAVRAVRKSQLKLGETVAIVGGGTIGLLIAQVARAAGASAVYVVEPQPARRDLAAALGATAAFAPADPESGLCQACNGVGPDVVFECAGAAETADLAVKTARKGGLIVLVGIRPERVPLSTLDVIVGEKRIVGTVQHHFDDDLPMAVQLLAEGKVQVGPLITAREPLARVVAGGFQALLDHPDQHLKILIGPRL
jgi:(R,R)-butanediol dehydrogenase / meso-butanediol dehydrogenase / diacetyl reductase